MPIKKTKLAQGELIAQLHNVLKEAMLNGMPPLEQELIVSGWELKFGASRVEGGSTCLFHGKPCKNCK